MWLDGDKNGIQASITFANLSHLNLSNLNLSKINFCGSSFFNVNISNTNLSDSSLHLASFHMTDFSKSNLSRAYVSGSSFCKCNLFEAIFFETYCSGADFSEARNIPETVSSKINFLPDGELIGWKKCRNNVIVKLKIPEESKKNRGLTNKCRAEFVNVLEVIGDVVGISIYDGITQYKVGKRVVCDIWCENIYSECSGGIHFYLSKNEAENHPDHYNLMSRIFI